MLYCRLPCMRLLKQGQKLHITFFEGEADVRVTGEQAQPDLFDFS